jgi:hypothetical protein
MGQKKTGLFARSTLFFREEESPVETQHRRLLRHVIPAYGVRTITQLGRRLGIPKQHAWLLWHGKIGLSAAMLRRVHDTCGVPLEALVRVERAVPAKPPGRKPRTVARRRTRPKPQEEAHGP